VRLKQGADGPAKVLSDRQTVNAQRDFGITPPKHAGAARSPPFAEAGQPRRGRGRQKKIKEYQ